MQTICQLCDCDVSDPAANIRPERQNKIVDGRLRTRSSWAWMCVPCHEAQGVGLGTGRGQLYDTLTGRKLEG
jgi:cytochrome c553